MCDSFNIPIVTFVDTPGFLPGSAQEHGGVITHGGKLLYAFCETTVPRVTVVTRKAIGGAYCVMSSKHTRCDVNLAYPTAQIAVMGADGAANIVFRKEIKEADDPDARREELREQYQDEICTPYMAAELGYIDDVIRPEETRPRIINALETFATKRDTNPPRKHGNIPL
jgi:propionyl-CoA carboxylase beta chain